MPRATDTRERVRELAAQIRAQGGEPTATLIRSVLGRGSPNLIVDELRRWRSEQTPTAASAVSAQISSPSALERLGLQDLAQALEQSRRLTAEQSEALASLQQLRTSMASTAQAVAAGVAQIASLFESLAQERKAIEAQVQAQQDRFEGVQRYMLRAIDDAREETRQWKERARGLQEELLTWRTTIQGRLDMLLAENGNLKGKLEALQPLRPLAGQPARQPVGAGALAPYERSLDTGTSD